MDIQHPGGVNEDIYAFSMATVMFGTLDLGSPLQVRVQACGTVYFG